MKLSISDLDTYSSMINSKILEIIEKINPQKIFDKVLEIID